MNEPHRLLIQGATEAERAMLRSASADGPPQGAVQRAMTTLDGLSAASAGPGLRGPGVEARVAARSIEVVSLAKIGLIGLLGAAGVIAGLMIHGRTGSQPDPAARPPSQAKAAERPFALVQTAPSEAKSAPPPRVTDRPDDPLSAELRLLDHARAALDARHAPEAKRALDNYAQRFPQGHLRTEAMVLRLAVLIRQGDVAAAKSLGQTLLASDSYRTYAPRIRSLLREIRE